MSWDWLHPAIGAGGGAPQPQQAAAPAAAPAPAQAPAGPQPGGIPPEFAQHVDPNNPMQAALIQRVSALTPQEGHAFFGGITAPALQVLKKIIPELGFVLDHALAGKGGAQPPPAGAPQAAPQAPPQPGSGLRQYG